jgi:hypothetical protein
MGPTKPGPSPKLVLIAAGLALLVLLGGGGLAYALTRDNGGTNPNGLGQSDRRDHATVTATAPAVPADEQCTDAIKANTRWVCLTKATMSDSELRIEYQFANGGTPFNITNGFHVHIYGANADGHRPGRQPEGLARLQPRLVVRRGQAALGPPLGDVAVQHGRQQAEGVRAHRQERPPVGARPPTAPTRPATASPVTRV